jgi:hypothetical protein
LAVESLFDTYIPEPAPSVARRIHLYFSPMTSGSSGLVQSGSCLTSIQLACSNIPVPAPLLNPLVPCYLFIHVLLLDTSLNWLSSRAPYSPPLSSSTSSERMSRMTKSITVSHSYFISSTLIAEHIFLLTYVNFWTTTVSSAYHDYKLTWQNSKRQEANYLAKSHPI